MGKLRFAVLGFGGRGQLFAGFVREDADAELTAVADVLKVCRETAEKSFGVPKEKCYASAEEFFAQGKIADAVFICTQDRQHREHAIAALELGYDVCLEKPVAATWEDCEAILQKQSETGKKVMICHVLRYSHFFGEIKKILQSGVLGDVVTYDQTENVAYWHDAHSYVRGAWRSEAESSPMILAKCCHDLDVIAWLLGKGCERVSSYGSLFYFKESNAPAGSADYCARCAKETKAACPYDAFKIYKDIYKAYNPILGNNSIVRGKAMNDIDAILNSCENKFGRCVFRCDNDVVDHQVVNMLFDGGITAHLTMTAFTKDCHRTVHICGTHGELWGDMEQNKIELLPFLGENKTVDLTAKYSDFSVHGGGDKLLYLDFKDYITKNSPSVTRTTLHDSLLSHYMCFRAERSRRNGGSSEEIRF